MYLIIIQIRVQYTLANPNSSVSMIEKIYRISKFVPICEITLIQRAISIYYNKLVMLKYYVMIAFFTEVSQS